jgi:hypothetical protein
MNPRAELRDRLHRIGYSVAPHMSQLRRITLIAALITQDSGKEVGAGTVKDWWYATDDDERTVDSRHMDWARAKSRQIVANDNHCLPCLSEVTEQVAA